MLFPKAPKQYEAVNQLVGNFLVGNVSLGRNQAVLPHSLILKQYITLTLILKSGHTSSLDPCITN